MRNFFRGKNQKGFTALEITIIVAVLAGIGVAGYFAVRNIFTHTVGVDKSTPAPLTTASPASPSPSRTPEQLSSITPNAGSLIQLLLPSGWSISDSNLVSIIGGLQYRINFQVTDSDYLQENTYAGDATTLDHVKTNLGTDVYVLKAQGDVVLSSCPPNKGYGCSMTQNGKPLFIFLHPFKIGDQAVEPIDFNSPSSTKAIDALKAVTKSLRL